MPQEYYDALELAESYMYAEENTTVIGMRRFYHAQWNAFITLAFAYL